MPGRRTLPATSTVTVSPAPPAPGSAPSVPPEGVASASAVRWWRAPAGRRGSGSLRTTHHAVTARPDRHQHRDDRELRRAQRHPAAERLRHQPVGDRAAPPGRVATGLGHESGTAGVSSAGSSAGPSTGPSTGPRRGRSTGPRRCAADAGQLGAELFEPSGDGGLVIGAGRSTGHGREARKPPPSAEAGDGRRLWTTADRSCGPAQRERSAPAGARRRRPASRARRGRPSTAPTSPQCTSRSLEVGRQPLGQPLGQRRAALLAGEVGDPDVDRLVTGRGDRQLLQPRERPSRPYGPARG